jgi:hypothetical protein
MPMKKPASLEQRLQHVQTTCGYPSPTRLMEALGQKPQQWRNWIKRGSLGRAPGRIKEVTGASIDWLLTGAGEPFPDGPTMYVGAADPGQAYALRVEDLERDVAHLTSAIGLVLRSLSEMKPDAGAALAADLRKFLAQPGRASVVLPALLAVAETAAPQASRAAPGKKPGTRR